MKVELTSHSAEETSALGRRIGRALTPGALVLLKGEMGSGKTLMCKAIYEGLGGQDPRQVISPTYALMNLYEDASCPIYHLDLFRLEDPKHLVNLEYEEFLFNDHAVTLIEWPREVESLLGDRFHLDIAFSLGDNMDERVIKLSASDESPYGVLTGLADS